MPTLTPMTSKSPLHTQNHRTLFGKRGFLLSSQKGFSLIEILVAMTLAALVLVSFVTRNEEGDHERLLLAMDNFDRILRFASNEAVLRNTIVRITVDMDESPQKFIIEAGPNGGILLPRKVEGNLYREEEEALAKEQEKINKQFQELSDLDEDVLLVPDNVYVLGVTQAGLNKISREGAYSLYLYPSGEKDESLIFFGTFDEIASLSVGAFEPETIPTFQALTDDDKIDQELAAKKYLQEMYQAWLK